LQIIRGGVGAPRVAKNGNFGVQTPETGRETAAKTMCLYYVVCPNQSYLCAKFERGDANVKIIAPKKPTDFGVRAAENFKVRQYTSTIYRLFNITDKV